MDTKLNINSIEAGSITYDKLNQDVVDKFNTKADSASVTNVSNRVTAIEELIATDSDAVIDKGDEVVTFLDGISATDDLEGILANKANTSTVNDLLNEKLDKTGGTLRSSSLPLTINRIDAQQGVSSIAFAVNDANVGILGFSQDGIGVIRPQYNTNSNYYTLLHAGNVGEYTAGAANKLAPFYGSIMRPTSANVEPTNDGSMYTFMATSSMTVGKPITDGFILNFEWDNSGYISQLFLGNGSSAANDPNKRMQARFWTANGWSDWESIAFTDSDITGNAATATKVSNVLKFGSKTFDGSSEQTITATDLGVTSSTVSDWGFTKNAGTVTSVATGTGLTGGPITGTGTISLNSTYQTYCTNGNAAGASYTTATSIASIPVGYKLVKCTISAAGSFALESTSITAGREIHIIIYNSSSSDVVVSLPTASPYVNFNADSLTVLANKYAEINVISDGSNLYIRTLA